MQLNLLPFAAYRLLALADAVAVPGLADAWLIHLPNKGGLLGTVFITLLAWWGVKRTRTALFAVDSYRFAARGVVKLLVFGLLLQLVAWVVS